MSGVGRNSPSSRASHTVLRLPRKPWGRGPRLRLDARGPRFNQLSLALGGRLAGWDGGAQAGCALSYPHLLRPKALGAPTPRWPRLTVLEFPSGEWSGECRHWDRANPPEREREAQPSARNRRALAPFARLGRRPLAPRTHPPHLAGHASPPGRPQGAREAGSGRVEAPRAGAGGARCARLCSPGGSRPGAADGRVASPPRGSRRRAARSPPHGRPPLPPPRVRPAPAPAAAGFSVGLRGRPAARARAELCLRVCYPESRDPCSFAPSSLPYSRPFAVIWSRSCRPLAVTLGSTGLSTHSRTPEGPLTRMSTRDPWIPRKQRSARPGRPGPQTV